MLGYATAKAVSQDAFDSAMADLLSSLSAVSITWVLSQKFCGLAPLTVLQEILSVLTSRGWFLNHLVDRSIRASEDLLLHYFLETGLFDCLAY